jgi:ketosteroid isomerase-like protein
MGTNNHMSHDEAEIRTLIGARVRAVRAKDVTAALARVDADVVLFDVVTPLHARGVRAERARLEEWVATFDGPIGYDMRDLVVVTDGAVAFSHCLNHYSGATRAGTLDMWVRATTGYRKRDGEWRITHEHQSTPFDPRSGKASLDLEP